jgi:hypothetical protein
MSSERMEEIKELLGKIRRAVPKAERRALAQYLWSFFDADDDRDVDEVINPLDRSYLEMKRDEEQLRRNSEILDTLITVGKIAINLAIKS